MLLKIVQVANNFNHLPFQELQEQNKIFVKQNLPSNVSFVKLSTFFIFKRILSTFRKTSTDVKGADKAPKTETFNFRSFQCSGESTTYIRTLVNLINCEMSEAFNTVMISYST